MGDQVGRRARHLTKLLEDPQERVGAPGLELLLNLGAEEVQGATGVRCVSVFLDKNRRYIG
eukprot:COSAG01_NODE_41039_length_456_cov_1.619048_1_plen_60_part_10